MEIFDENTDKGFRRIVEDSEEEFLGDIEKKVNKTIRVSIINFIILIVLRFAVALGITLGAFKIVQHFRII